MRPIPLNFLTLYADLVQNVKASTLDHGKIKTRTRRGSKYLYSVHKNGASKVEKYLGPADDPEVLAQADRIKDAAEQARHLRSTVSALKQARFPAPSLQLGKVLEVLANAGLFEKGLVLVGTAAYQTYPGIVGSYLPTAALMTNDADLLAASFVSDGESHDLETILKKADRSFSAKMAVTDKLPKVFVASNNFQVDVLTKFGRGRKSPIIIDSLGCSAEALKFMEYLAEESMPAVSLYGTGVLIKVPSPVRFATHKLLIAQERKTTQLAKKRKDLMQARELIDIFLETDDVALQTCLDEARQRGRAWKTAINASLREIGRTARQGSLPFARKQEKR